MTYFCENTFSFLENLSLNNHREWFEQHKNEYETWVRQPALDFIADMSEPLAQISPHFNAIAKKVGGSLMRVQRDVRFSRSKAPYKTNIGIQFRHSIGKDVHAPGFYLHIAYDECFIGVGMWQPEANALNKVRQYLVAQPEHWLKTRDDATFRQLFQIEGSRLSNPPRGYAKDHPLIEDLKYKDFIAIAPLQRAQILSPELLTLTAQHFAAASPFMRFLCQAIEVQY